MKTVIFCGGMGNRLKELTEEIPKPLVEIGDKPVLWHIMKIYSHYGFKDFILCLGYKGHKIKDYFVGDILKKNDFTLENEILKIHNRENGDWRITFVDTGDKSTKAERLLKIKPYLDKDENFFVTYGDDVSDVNINELIRFHKENNKIITLTATKPKNPYGVIELDGNIISNFKEKPLMNEWVNSGFSIFNKKIFENINLGEDLEEEVFARLAKKKEICAFKHEGFWQGMNTFKESQELNKLWENGKAHWKIWN